MCYEFRNWSWKGRAKETAQERPVDSAKREATKAPPKAPERPAHSVKERDKVPA